MVDNDGAAAGSGNSGGTEVVVAGVQSAAGASDGSVASAPDETAADPGPFSECSTGDSSEPCGWSLASEFTGAVCTPGELLQLGCCDCGEDAVMRVCDGSTACSDSAELGFSDDACQACPVVEFTCPDSGIFSALTGSFPFVQEDGSPPPPSACRPKLVELTDNVGAVDGAGTVGFEAIHPILVTHCSRCHGEGGLQDLLDLPPFASSDIELAFEPAQSVGSLILAQMSSGTMPPDSCTGRPPGSVGCVSAEEFDLIRKWYINGAAR